MADYHKLDIKQLPKTSQLTAEDRYWKKFKHPIYQKHFVKVTDIKFSPIHPHDLAACASSRVTIYDGVSCDPIKTISRFKSIALSCSYRRDGRLLSVSSGDGLIQIFDISSRMILRTLKGHEGNVWGVYASSNYSWLYSAGDDKTVRKWDVASETLINTYTGHNDYVRLIQQEQQQEQIIISGSYDQSIKYWDTRIEPSNACVLTLTQGAPVSALLQLPTTASGSLITAGDVHIKVWDTRFLLSSTASSSSSGTTAVSPIQSLSNHQKTITSLSLDGTNSRILSSSLDGFIKITSLASLSVLSSIKYPQPILCAAVSPENTILAAGMVDGTLNLRQRTVPPPSTAAIPAAEKEYRMGSSSWFSRGAASIPADDDYRLIEYRKQRLKPYDSYLKKFQYHQALDAALRTNKAVIICSLCDELIDRSALYIAISGRNEDTLAPLLNFLLQYLLHPYYTSILLDVITVVFSIYSPLVGHSIMMDEWVEKINERVRMEKNIQQFSMKMMGGMEMIWKSNEVIHQQRGRQVDHNDDDDDDDDDDENEIRMMEEREQDDTEEIADRLRENIVVHNNDAAVVDNDGDHLHDANADIEGKAKRRNKKKKDRAVIPVIGPHENGEGTIAPSGRKKKPKRGT